MKRREFLHRSILAAGALALTRYAKASPREAFDAPVRKFANDRVALGPDKLNLSRLAMGTGTSGFRGSSSQTRQLGVKGLTELYQFGYDNGLTFWDTADGYGSHPHLRNALKYIPRDKVVIMTKSQSKTCPRSRRRRS